MMNVRAAVRVPMMLMVLALTACVMSPEEELERQVRALGTQQRPDYIAADCARFVASAQEVPQSLVESILFGPDPRNVALEERSAILGCDPRR